MAVKILKNAHITYAGNDLSNYVESLELTYEVETQDDTTMGDTTRSQTAGLYNWSASATLQETTGAAVVAILWSLIGTSGLLLIKAEDTTVSSSNPSYSGYAMVPSLPVVSGTVGDKQVLQITFMPCKGSNTATLTRSTSA